MGLFHAAQALRARPWVGYGAALALPAAALGLRFAMGDALEGYPFLTFFPAVLVTAFVGGSAPGALATALSGALSSYYLVPPLRSFSLGGTSGQIGMASFVAVSATIVALVESAAGAARQLERANADLERRVTERTRELDQANAALRAEIATREAAEAQLRQAQKMEAIGQLTGGIAHDFNNMLSVIVSSLELGLRRLSRGRTDVADMIDQALDGANRAAGLTRRLLAFSRQQPLAPVVIDVNALVQGMAELLRRTIGEPTQLECVLAGGLWRAHVDPGQLESAILNLAVNARDAMPDGGRLTVETQNAHLDDIYAAAHAEVAPGQYVVVAVSDTGAGMDAATAGRAFDPFFTTKETGRGTGLGLSQVYGFIKQSAGHVKIYSEPGQGTTVKLYLPRAMGRAGTATPAREPPAEAILPPGTAGETILVVEDDGAVRQSTVASLRELGYTVRQAASGREALTALEAEPGIALVFTDVVMPGMTGRQLADEISSRWPDLPVLYTTGYTQNAIVHSGVLDPGVELLQKPFPLDHLARKLRRMLDNGSRAGDGPGSAAPDGDARP